MSNVFHILIYILAGIGLLNILGILGIIVYCIFDKENDDTEYDEENFYKKISKKMDDEDYIYSSENCYDENDGF